METPENQIRLWITDNYKLLYSYAFKLTKHKADAEDLVQDAIINILKAAPTATAGNIKGYCMVILHNKFISKLRLRKRYVNMDFNGPMDPELVRVEPRSQEEACYVKELLADMEKLLTPHEQTIIVELANGLKYDEVSAKHRITLGTVKSAGYRGRQKLKAYAEERPVDNEGPPPG